MQGETAKGAKNLQTTFNILNNILPCNKNFFKWGKSETKSCSVCQGEESISHLLFSCFHVRPLREVVNGVLLPGETVSHSTIIFDMT